MTSTQSLKTSFDVVNKVEAFYTGGQVIISGSSCYCTCGDTINKLDLNTGKIVQSYHENEDSITCLSVSPDEKKLIVATQSLLLLQWDLESNTVSRRWKAVQKTPILHMNFDKSSTLLATGSSDATVKVYDTEQKFYTHNFKGSVGVVSVVQFHDDPLKLMLFSAADDGKIRLWDLATSKCMCVLEGHFSAVTCLVQSEDFSTMASCGRDNVIILWDMMLRKQQKTIPVFECIESITRLPLPSANIYLNNKVDQNDQYFVTAGEKGLLRVWNMLSGRCMYADKRYNATDGSESDKSISQSIQHISYVEESNRMVAVTNDHNIVSYSMEDMKKKQEFIGYYDEILDLHFFGPEDESVVIATNSEQIKVIDRKTLSCRVISGHSGTVLGLDVSHDNKYIASCSKDNSIMVWKFNETLGEFQCVAIGNAHNHSVDAIAWSRCSSDFLMSASKDMTIKHWKVPETFEEEAPVQLSARWTQIAHDKDINSVAVSPDDKLVASASQDKLVKIWKSKKGSLAGVLRGHKRGIWCVVFSPIDRCLATSSVDSTIKIWALSDFTCVKSFEGHTNSVLRIQFINKGMQIISSGSDGLLKVWAMSSSECLNTLDQHEDKIWALACTLDGETIVSGGGDSLINFWKNVTEEELAAEREKHESRIVNEQELSNLLQQKQFVKAIALAITLEQPFRVLNIFKGMLVESDGKCLVERTVKALRDDQLNALLGFMREWNTNSKHSYAAQTVCSTLLRLKSPEELMKFPNIKETIEGLLPYTERHFQRMNKLVQQSTFIDYTWKSMKLLSTSSQVSFKTLTGDNETKNGTLSETVDSESKFEPSVIEINSPDDIIENGHEEIIECHAIMDVDGVSSDDVIDVIDVTNVPDSETKTTRSRRKSKLNRDASLIEVIHLNEAEEPEGDTVKDATNGDSFDFNVCIDLNLNADAVQVIDTTAESDGVMVIDEQSTSDEKNNSGDNIGNDEITSIVDVDMETNPGEVELTKCVKVLSKSRRKSTRHVKDVINACDDGDEISRNGDVEKPEKKKAGSRKSLMIDSDPIIIESDASNGENKTKLRKGKKKPILLSKEE